MGPQIPRRADGTPKVWWYDRKGDHIIRRCPDGSLEALGFECRHPVQVPSD